jgi:alcohol dehydrogenase
MRVARLHTPGQGMVLEDVPWPAMGKTDALVAVKACGLVPNIGQILARVAARAGYPQLPKLPAGFGFNTTGVLRQLGEPCRGLAMGDRVFVSPALSCGKCEACTEGDPQDCANFAILGYFGFGAQAQALFDAYPHGGYSQFVVAPAANLVRLPHQTSFEQATRFGYLATALSCLNKASLNKAGALAGRTLLINGITGTIGLSTCLVALALGAAHILGTGRQAALLDKVAALAPGRITTHNFFDGPISDFARSHSADLGVPYVVDCLGPSAPGALMQDAIYGLRRGGCLVNVNGIGTPVALDLKWMQSQQIRLLGNNWCTSEDIRTVSDMVGAGRLDLSALSTVSFALADINDAMVKAADRPLGGFSTAVIIA